jgi:citrate lyase subunit beta/citryl-CoA lyase
VVVPKVAGAQHLAEVEKHLTGDVRIWAMIETPSGVFSAREIAAVDRVTAFIMGTNDLAKELRAALVPGRAPLLPHLATALLAAREAGIVALDGVYNDVKDLEGFEAECVQGMQMGFDGKTLVHPTQVDVANRVWSPSEAEIEQARKVIAAFDEASRAGHGVVTVDGRMIENLHVDNARRTLAVAAALAAG